MRKEGSRKQEKLSEIHKNYILKLIADSSFNTSNRIALKLKNSYEVEIYSYYFSVLSWKRFKMKRTRDWLQIQWEGRRELAQILYQI